MLDLRGLKDVYFDFNKINFDTNNCSKLEIELMIKAKEFDLLIRTQLILLLVIRLIAYLKMHISICWIKKKKGLTWLSGTSIALFGALIQTDLKEPIWFITEAGTFRSFLDKVELNSNNLFQFLIKKNSIKLIHIFHIM